MIVKWTWSSLLPPDVGNDQLESTYCQRQPALRISFARDTHHERWIFHDRNLKFMCKMVWFLGAWATLCKHGALREMSSQETWQLKLESSNHGFGMLFFSSSKWDIVGKWYKVMESKVVHMPALIFLSALPGIGRANRVSYVSLVDMFRFVQNTFDRDEDLQGADVRHFWNVLTNQSP